MRKYLIVDDNIGLADNLAEIISGAAVGEAVLADGGVAALVLAADTQFDALVSDVRMPHMSGVDLVRRVRLMDPGLPVVLMTAHSEADELISARRGGILSVLPKPIPIAGLLHLLAHARRDGVVALVGPETALKESLAQALRSNGFAPATALSLPEAATLGTYPFAIVADIRTLSDLDSYALLRMAALLPEVPILVVITESQRSQPARESIFFTSWSDPHRMLNELKRLCGRRPGPRGTSALRYASRISQAIQ